MEHITLASGSSYFRSPGVATAAAIAALQVGKTYYGPTEGTDKLRYAIVKRYLQEEIPITPAQVLITPGTKQALYNLFTVLLRDQDEVVVPTPAWFGFYDIMKYSKGNLINITTKLSERYSINPEALRKVLSPRSRILLLTNPGNPTGRIYTKQELEAILKVTAEFPNLYVISDEIYDFVTYGEPVTPLLSCKGIKRERTIILNGFSKSFAMSGWRLGYIVGPEDLIADCTDFQSSTFSGASVFVQDAAVATLDNKQDVLPQMLKVLHDNRQIMQQALDDIPQVSYYLPDGAYYFFPDLSFYLDTKTPEGENITTTEGLCRYLKEQFKLELAPGDRFGAPGHVRMSFAVERHKLTEAMNRLQQALKQLKW